MKEKEDWDMAEIKNLLEKEPFQALLRPFREYLQSVWADFGFPYITVIGDLKTNAQLIFGELVITPKDLEYDKEHKVLKAKIYKYDQFLCELLLTEGEEIDYEFSTDGVEYKPLDAYEIDALLDLK